MDNLFQNIQVSKGLKKPVALPNANEFAIHPEEDVVTGLVHSNVKSKGLFVNQISATGERQMAVTKHGYLIIWMKFHEGFVLDVREANSIMTVFKNTKNFGMVTHNCNLKIKFASGTVNLFLKNEKIKKWLGVIGDLYDGMMVVANNGQSQPAVTNDEDTIEINNNSELEDNGDNKSVLDTTYTEALPSNPKSDGPVSSGSDVSVHRSDSQLSGKNSTKSISTRSPVAVATPATPKTPVVPLAPFSDCKTPVTPDVPKTKSAVKTPVLLRTPKLITDNFHAPAAAKEMAKPKPDTTFCIDYTVPMALLSKIDEAVAEPCCKSPPGVFKDHVDTTAFKKPSLFLTAPKRKLTKSRTDVVNKMVQAESLKKPDTPRPLKITSKLQKISFVESGHLPSLFGKAALDSPSSRHGTEPGRCESGPAAFNYDDIQDKKTVDPRLINPEKKESKAEVKKETKSVKFNVAPYDGFNDSICM